MSGGRKHLKQDQNVHLKSNFVVKHKSRLNETTSRCTCVKCGAFPSQPPRVMQIFTGGKMKCHLWSRKFQINLFFNEVASEWLKRVAAIQLNFLGNLQPDESKSVCLLKGSTH